MKNALRFSVATLFLVGVAGMACGEEKGSRLSSGLVWCGAKAADLGTTEWALSNGAHENNPLMRNRSVRIGAGVATCALAGEVDYRLRSKRKTRWAFRALGIGLMAYAAQRNARVAH